MLQSYLSTIKNACFAVMLYAVFNKLVQKARDWGQSFYPELQ